MINVLFVCLGNICRSPLAEGVFNSLVDARGLGSKIQCDSAGTSGWHVGERPDERAIDVAHKHGIRLNHRGRRLNTDDFDAYDYIIAMDQHNYEDILSLQGNDDAGPFISLMRDFDDLGKGQQVPDPYYGGVDGFENVYKILVRSCANLLDHIIDEQNL